MFPILKKKKNPSLGKHGVMGLFGVLTKAICFFIVSLKLQYVTMSVIFLFFILATVYNNKCAFYFYSSSTLICESIQAFCCFSDWFNQCLFLIAYLVLV